MGNPSVPARPTGGRQAGRKIRLGVLASGRGTNLQAIIDAIEAKKINAVIKVVLSDREQALALKRARRHRVKAVFLNPKSYSTREKYDERIVEILKQHKVDLVVLSGYMRIVTSQFIKSFHHKIINIHPSLLPSFTGLQAQQQALKWGVRISGCTVHFVDEEVDHGPIIIQGTVPVYNDDTEGSLSSRILEEEHRILPQAIQYIAEGRLEVVGRQVILKDRKSNSKELIVSPPLDVDL